MAEFTGSQKPRRLGAMLAALALGACQIIPDSAPPPGTSSQPPSEVPAEEAPQPPAPSPAPPTPGPAPAPAPAPAPVEARHKVAILVPLTGPNAGVGTSVANAARLALADSGDAGIVLATYDTARGAGVAAQAALAEGNRLFLGPLTAEEVRLVGPHARAADVPVLAFSNDAGVAGNGAYILGFTPGQSIERVVRHARAEGAVRFAGLIPAGLYGARARAELRETVDAVDGKMVSMVEFQRTPAGIERAVRTLNAQARYDAVLIADQGRLAAIAAPLIRAGPSATARILGTELWATERDLGATAALRGARFAAVPDTMFGQLAGRYRARYSRSPYRLASLGYDATLLAVRIARDWRAGDPFPRRLLTDATGFAGIDGAFRFRGNGTAERMLAVHEITAGGETIVSPAARSFAD